MNEGEIAKLKALAENPQAPPSQRVAARRQLRELGLPQYQLRSYGNGVGSLIREFADSMFREWRL